MEGGRFSKADTGIGSRHQEILPTTSTPRQPTLLNSIEGLRKRRDFLVAEESLVLPAVAPRNGIILCRVATVTPIDIAGGSGCQSSVKVGITLSLVLCNCWLSTLVVRHTVSDNVSQMLYDEAKNVSNAIYFLICKLEKKKIMYFVFSLKRNADMKRIVSAVTTLEKH